MTRLSKLLLMASIAIMLTGIGLAVAQPGSLGDDDASPTRTPSEDEVAGGPTTTTGPSTTDTSTTAATPTSTTPTTTATTAPGASPSSTAPTAATPESSDGTGGGSGVGSDGTDSGGDTSDDLAETGGESLIVAGVLFGALGLELRRRSVRST